MSNFIPTRALKEATLKLLSPNFTLLSERSLETLTAAIVFTLFITSPLSGWSLFIYLLTTRFWWISLLYSIWLVYDLNTPDFGGRPRAWIHHAKFWKYGIGYFPAKVTLSPGFDLDPKRNYLTCVFPHGVISIGQYLSLTCTRGDFHKLYPQFKVKTAGIRMILLTPFMRELLLGMGFVSCSADSLSYILSRPEGGHMVSLNPGGAAESYYSKPGKYVFLVKKRKGFVKIALRNGVPLIPAITFGEVNVFKQFESEKLKLMQELIKKLFGFAPIIFYGRGITESSVGWVPMRRPLTTVLGTPIEVVKTANPTNQQIDELHQIFLTKLMELFENYKYEFLENPDEQRLVIE